MWFRNDYVASVFVVCVKINNYELFCNAFPFENAKSVIIFLDRLFDVVCTYYCVARVTWLVYIRRSRRCDYFLVLLFMTYFLYEIMFCKYIKNNNNSSIQQRVCSLIPRLNTPHQTCITEAQRETLVPIHCNDVTVSLLCSRFPLLGLRMFLLHTLLTHLL